jgi:SAM-dependent methyltransferase
MHANARAIAEQRFHDAQAASRAECFRRGRADLIFTDSQYLDHETWIRPAQEKLGQLRGRRVLDYGCGHGMAAVVMARAGATVSAIDLSPGYVVEARRRAEANRVEVDCVVGRCEELPFADHSFDAVWGNAVLHHLDLDRAARELDRVMKPGAVAVFCEPWGGNPLLALARRLLPYPGKERTRDERPLRPDDLAPLRATFDAIDVEGFQLLGMVRRVWANTAICGRLDRIDGRLCRAFPALANWCRYAVLTVRKRPT